MEKQIIAIWLVAAIIVVVCAILFGKSIYYYFFPKEEADEAAPEADEAEEKSILSFLLKNEEAKKLLGETAEGRRYLQELALSEAAIGSSELNMKLLKARLEELGLWEQLKKRLSMAKKEAIKGKGRVFGMIKIAIFIFAIVVIAVFLKKIGAII